MEVTGQEYKKMNDQTTPCSPILRNCIIAFLVGGLICAIGQVITGWVVKLGLGLDSPPYRLVGIDCGKRHFDRL